ncbi:hypothetical protein DFJ77DRAFT_465086, partial [Powellomyces hirtus]
MEAHFRAAEQFLSAVSYTSDAEATRTLKLLYSNHTRQGKDLQRRLQTRSPSSSPRITPRGVPPRPQSAQFVSHQPPPKVPVTAHDSRRQSFSSSNAPSMQRAPSQSSDPRFRQQHGGNNLMPFNPHHQAFQHHGGDNGGERSEFGSRNYFVGQSQTGSELATSMFRGGDPSCPAYGGGGNVLNHASPGPATMAVTSLDESHRSLSRSHTMDSVADSYSVVAKGHEEDPEDPFNKFWEAVENLVDKISITGPVAFATAPIGNSPHAQEVRQADTDRSHGNLNASLRSTQMLNSYLVVPPTGSYPVGPSQMSMTSTVNAYGNPIFYNGGVVVSESDGAGVVGSIESNYFGNAMGTSVADLASSSRRAGRGGVNSFSDSDNARIPPDGSGQGARDRSRHPMGGPQISKTKEELLLENHHLKQTLNNLTHRMALLERTTEENNLLRSSIIQFRQDVQKQVSRGRRGMGVSMISGRDGGRERDRERERELEARVRELELELRTVRDEGQRMTTAMNKYKERWDRLKESAKKKKEAASSSSGTGGAAITDDPMKAARPSPSPSPSLQHLYGSTPPSDMSHPPSPPPTTYGTSPADDHMRSALERGGGHQRDSGGLHGQPRGSIGTDIPPPTISSNVAMRYDGGKRRASNSESPVTPGGASPMVIPPPSNPASSGSNSIIRSSSDSARLGRSMLSFAGDRSLFYSATSGSGF